MRTPFVGAERRGEAEGCEPGRDWCRLCVRGLLRKSRFFAPL